MADFNRVILIGNLTRDPDYREGHNVANLGLAVNRRWTGKDGEKREEATYVECTAWGRQAETLAQYVGRGDPLMIEGRLTLDRWQDSETGQDRQRLKVTIERFQFLGSGGSQGRSRQGGQRRQGREPPQDTGSEPADVDPDTIPF